MMSCSGESKRKRKVAIDATNVQDVLFVPIMSFSLCACPAAILCCIDLCKGPASHHEHCYCSVKFDENASRKPVLVPVVKMRDSRHFGARFAEPQGRSFSAQGGPTRLRGQSYVISRAWMKICECIGKKLSKMQGFVSLQKISRNCRFQ